MYFTEEGHIIIIIIIWTLQKIFFIIVRD